MLSQVLATRRYLLHNQDFCDVFHPDLPFSEETDNPPGGLVIYDHQAAHAASRYQPCIEHRPAHGEHAREHDSDEPEHICTRRRGSFQARAFAGYSRSRSVPSDRARSGPQSLSHEDERTPPGPTRDQITYIIQQIPLDASEVEWCLRMGIPQDA